MHLLTRLLLLPQRWLVESQRDLNAETTECHAAVAMVMGMASHRDAVEVAAALRLLRYSLHSLRVCASPFHA